MFREIDKRSSIDGEKNMWEPFLVIVLLAGFVAGCNTIQGADKDIERGGEKFQDSAEKHKN